MSALGHKQTLEQASDLLSSRTLAIRPKRDADR